MLGGPRKFIKFLGMLLLTKKLQSRMINNEFSVFIFLFMLAVYHFLFLLLLTILDFPIIYYLVLAVIAIHAYCFIFFVRFIYYLIFENTSFLNPKTVYPDFPINASKVVSNYSFFYLSLFTVDFLFILMVFVKPDTHWLFSSIALIIFVDLLYFIFYYFFLLPLKKIRDRYISEHDSDIIVYLAGMINTEYQMDQWLPILEKLSQKYKTTIVFYESHFISYGTRLAIPAMRIINVRKLSEIIDQGNAKVIFYLNNNGFNYNLLIFKKYIHVHLNHGDSDKAANAESTAKDYDYLFIAGQASVERHLRAGWDREKLKVVGRPQLEFFGKDKVKVKEGGRKTVLYAPTFEGNKETDCYSSIDKMGMEIVKGIIESKKYRLVVKLHPYTGVFLEKYRRISGEMKRYIRDHAEDGHLWVDQLKPEISLYDLFLEADVVISDISSVAIDYLVLNRPIIATDPFAIGRVEGEEKYPFWKGSYVLGLDDDVVGMIDDAIVKDPMRKERENVAKYYLGDNVFDYKGMVDNFIRTVDEIIENQLLKE